MAGTGLLQVFILTVVKKKTAAQIPFVLHAEQNALIKMAKSSESIDGAELFCTHSPCPDCSKMIAQAGVKKVYYRHEYRITDGIDVLKQLGVEIEKM